MRSETLAPPIGFGTMPVSGSISGGKSKIDSDYASVIEQSGIKAGDDGFQITVAGNTDLKGAVITSSDKAIEDNNNSLTTDTLTASDIANKAEYKGSSFGLGLSYSSETAKNPDGTDKKDENGNPVKTGYNGFNAGVPTIALAKDDEASITTSAISAGTVTITDSAGQEALTGKDADQTVASINRDTSATENSLKPIFDEEEIKAGFEIWSGVSQEVGTFLDNRAKESDAKNEEARKKEEQILNDDTLTQEQRVALIEEAARLKDEAKAWQPGSTERQLLTAFTAAASGNLSGSTSELVQAGVVNYLQQQGASYIGQLVSDGTI